MPMRASAAQNRCSLQHLGQVVPPAPCKKRKERGTPIEKMVRLVERYTLQR